MVTAFLDEALTSRARLQFRFQYMACLAKLSSLVICLLLGLPARLFSSKLPHMQHSLKIATQAFEYYIPLHTAMRVAELSACFCSVNGTVAAVRLATYHADGKRAEHEAQVYERLKHLQGDCVPRLLEHGHILKEPDAYFVAMEFIEVHQLGTSTDTTFPYTYTGLMSHPRKAAFVLSAAAGM